ncbi:ABC transporter substrate-binding protein [Vampirovibrio chlorellavorus]|uniref:ABC transporter substrate-binding protein n=1 Tax=Vampirovibrio chlorellavorus TaxID=758823 RepID=UPI0026EA6770|nr:ABC transporter substrate-binding protein [Vampirovibrio chlorellavorus]
MKRTLSALSIVMVLGTMAGCAPPPPGGSTAGYGKSIAGEGKPILSVKPTPRGPFQTVLVNGAELMQARGHVGQFGGTFYDNQISDGPKTFNPWASTDATSSTLGGMLYAGLVTTDAYTGEPIPYLAKSVKIGDDKMTYTVTLRKGLKWSDGQPLTAKDVVFTWNEIVKAGLGNASHRDVVLVDGKFPEVKALDDLTVQFKTAKPFAPFLRNLGEGIAPAHIFKPVVAKGDAAFSAFMGVSDAAKTPEKFVSGGMWLLESYVPRQKAVFKRNPNFFMVDAQNRRLPYMDRYSMSFVGDMNNQGLQFEQGKVDVYNVPGNLLSHLRQLKKPDFSLYNLGPASGTVFMTLNLNNRKNDQGKPFVDPIKSAWFRDVNFRQAINHTIKRQDIVDNILKGVGAPLFTSEALASIYLNQKLAKGFEADPTYARELLKKSGFTWDKQGILHDKQGHVVEFNLYTNSGNTEREAIGVNIKQDLAQLGMKVNFKPIDFNVLIGNLKDGSWEAMIMGLTGSQLEPHSGANVWRSDGSIHMFNQRKIEAGKPTDISDRLPWEKQLDDLIEQGSQTFDVQARHKIYDQLQQVVYDQAPFIYLYSPLNVLAVRTRIQNVDPTPLEAFHNLEEVWIQEK